VVVKPKKNRKTPVAFGLWTKYSINISVSLALYQISILLALASCTFLFLAELGCWCSV
jgi:hypothetical protein